MKESEKPIGGTQSVARALTLLKLIAGAHPHGLSVPEIVDATRLERATAHRIAASLVQAGFVQRDERKRYRLGLEAMQLGLAAMSRAPLLDAIQPAMQALARLTEDTIYLVVRNGDYGHTLHREEGPFPIKTFTSIVGATRLLGLGTAGQALMALMSPDEVKELYRRHKDEYDAKGISSLNLLDVAARTSQRGVSITEGLITPGVIGIGKAFQVTQSSYAAISVAAIKYRMDAKRRKWIAEVMADEITRFGFKPQVGATVPT